MQTIMYRTVRKPYQYQSSVSAAHKLQQFAANNVMVPATTNYPKRSLVSANDFSDPNLNWSTETPKTMSRETQQRVLTANAVVHDKRPQHWPGIGLPPPLKEHGQSVPQYSLNQNVPSHLSSLQDMGRKPSGNPMYPSNNSAQKIGCPDQHYGVNSHSAFSRPTVSPSAVNSLDVEIRRLRGMITRVEMLREKYKYQEGVLHYPNTLPVPHPSPIYRGTLPASPTRSNPIATWFTEQPKQPTDIYQYPNMHPLKQHVSQNPHPNSGMNKMTHRQQVTPAIQFPKSPEHTQRAAFLDLNQYDGMPKIVDVRSLAVDVQGQHRNKKESQNSQTYSMKGSPSAKSCNRSTTDTRKDTGSVESHDSGVECTSSPIEMKSKKNKQFVYGRTLSELPTDDEVLVREEHRLSMFHYQVPYAPTSVARSAGSHRLPGPITSPPPLIQNPRKRLSHAANETEVLAKKSKALDRPGTTGPVSVSGTHDEALDLTLRKIYGQSETHTNGLRIKTEPNTEPINSPLPGICSCSEHRPDHCPSRMLHHHRETRSMDLYAKFAQEIPARNTSERNPTKNRPQQHLDVRNRFISSFMQTAEGILHQKSDRETQSNNFAQGFSSIGQDKSSKDENTLENGGSNSSSTNHLGKKQAATKSLSKPRRNLKSQTDPLCLTPNKSKSCIDALVNEALRLSRSSSSRRNELSLNPPLVETEQSGAYRSSGTVVINHVETENCTGGACGITDMHGSCLAEETPQNATTGPSYTCTQTVQTKRPEASFHHLEPFFQNPTDNMSKSTTRSPTEAEQLNIKFTAYCNGKLTEVVGSEFRVMDPTSSVPNFQVPTEDGFRRFQRVDDRLHEIYRVIMTTSTTKEHPLNRKQAAQSVWYREMSFPCVLRSEVPFIPTHLLVQILFPGVEVATVCRALQKCNILNRYMTRTEQDALREGLREHGLTSCKLVPLDELHDNWDELLTNLSLD